MDENPHGESIPEVNITDTVTEVGDLTPEQQILSGENESVNAEPTVTPPDAEEGTDESRMEDMSEGAEVTASEDLTVKSQVGTIMSVEQDPVEYTKKHLLGDTNFDAYNDDQNELRFLLSKPTCFLVLGKPGAGKTVLAQRIALEWKCVLVSPITLLMQAMELETELGVKLKDLLLRGEAVPEEMIIKLIEEKISSEEVKHHGYVLDGFPCMTQDNMTYTDQIELVKSWKLQPDFIINVKIPDKDLENRRVGQRIDPVTGEIYTKEMYDPDKKPPPPEIEVGEGEEEEEEEELDEELGEEEGDVGSKLEGEVIGRLLKRPEDLIENTSNNIQAFKDNMLRILEDYMGDHDQQKLIELDANQPVNILIKQILSKLNCFPVRPAAVIQRILDGEEDEIPEETETDELMRLLSGKKTVGSRFRWRRSRWLRNCPVSLHQGNISPGKPEFAVSFLDKIYTLSDAEAMEKFMKNPRPYLLPPQPRPPCKIIVLGSKTSGKTSLAHLVADKYNAKVLDMTELIKPSMSDLQKQHVDQVRTETTEQAITAIQQKFRDEREAALAAKQQAQADAEALARAEAASNAETLEEDEVKADQEEGEDGEKKESEDDENKADAEVKQEEEKAEEGEKKEEEDEVKADEEKEPTESTADTGADSAVADSAVADTPVADSAVADTPVADSAVADTPVAGGPEAADNQTGDDTASKISLTITEPDEEPLEIVTADHPEVKRIVEVAVEEAGKQEMVVSSELYIEVLEKAIQDTEAELREKRPDAPLYGGWVVDNFPRTREEWMALNEKGIQIDEVIVLRDSSDNFSFLQKRWYRANRDQVDRIIREKVEEEARKKARKDEEARLKVEAAAEAEKLRIEEKKQRLLAEAAERGEIPETGSADVAAEEKVEDEEEEEKGADGEEEDDTGALTDGVSETQVDEAVTEVEPEEETVGPPVPEEEPLPPECPETEAFKKELKDWESDWTAVQSVIMGGSNVDPLIIDIQDKRLEDILDETVTQMERTFIYQGWEVSGLDLDEEEEDIEKDGQEEEEDGEEEAEEEEDPNRSKKKALGDTNHFCPVLLQENQTLYPGNPEIAAKYKEKFYYFSTNEAREKFLLDPVLYLPKDKPFTTPPIRLLILGPKGAGKSMNGRYLAKKLGLFHISFHERLQELIMMKTKGKKLGPEYEEEAQPQEEEEEEEELEAGITAPDGSTLPPNDTPTENGSDVRVAESTSEAKAEEAGEEEEEAEPEFTEEEEAIKANLETDDALPNEVLDKIVPDWWKTEPFKSTGFLLEGFPRTTDEAQYLAENGLFPDAAIILTVEDGDVIGRLLPPKLDKWKEKRDKNNARKQKKKDKEKKKRDSAIAKRRAELQAEVDERRAAKLAEKGEKDSDAEEDNSDADEEVEEEEEEEEEEIDIDAVLAEEFEEEEEEEEDEEEEQEEDAVDRLRNDLAEVYDNDTNRLAAVQDMLEELMVPRVDVDAGRKPHIVRYIIQKLLRPYSTNRQGMFERCYTITERLAARMISSGYKQLSRFGRWDPVQLHEGDCIQPMASPAQPTHPVIYRSSIYYLSSTNTRQAFVENPLEYLRQESPRHVVPARLAVIGPPKSGKSTLARRFAEEYGCMRLSIGEAVRSVLTNQPKSNLATTMNSHLHRGLTVPEELKVAALETVILDMRCQTRGYVLDGYPVTKQQVDLLTERGIVPVRVLDVTCESKEIMVRGTKDRVSTDRSYPAPDSAQVLALRLAAFQNEISAIRDHYAGQHKNVITVNGEQSKWHVWNYGIEVVRNSIDCIQTYLHSVGSGKAACLANLCITPTEFMSRVGLCGHFCPVSLALRDELLDCSRLHQQSLQFAAEFRGYYYRLAGSAELEKFLASPEQFVPPLAPRSLPATDQLPTRVTPEMVKQKFPQQIEMKGYCPVAYTEGKFRYESIIPGDVNCVVEYRDKLYQMENDGNVEKFLRTPDLFSKLTLPHKLPPLKRDVLVTKLPMLGYMEQSVSTALTKALTAAGCFKPKYPFLSPTKSALVYVGYHLKAFNPRSSDYIRAKYKRKLEQFEDTCRLIEYLGDKMTVTFKETKERPIDFDHKLSQFLQLESDELSSLVS